MARINLIAALAALTAGAQQTINLVAPPPPSVSVVSASASAEGTGTFCYWVVAQYQIGAAAPSEPYCISKAGGTVTVHWNPMPYATSYDVLRTTNSNPPTSSANIAIATGATGTSQEDTLGVAKPYTFKPVRPAAAQIALDNLTGNAPQVKVSGNVAIQGSQKVGDALLANALCTVPFPNGTDDTAALQSAIDAVDHTHGGNIIFCRGTYKLSDHLRTKWPNVHLIGNGTTLSSSHRGDAILVDSSGSQVEITGFVIHGPALSGSNGIHVVAGAYGPIDINIHDNDISRYGDGGTGTGAAIRLDISDTHGLKIEHNIIDQNGGDGISLNGSTDGLEITNNKFAYNAGWCVYATGSPGAAAQRISHNNFYCSTGAVKLDNVGVVILTDNESEQPACTGANSAAYDLENLGHPIYVTHNSINSSSLCHYGIYLGPRVSRSLVGWNAIAGQMRAGIYNTLVTPNRNDFIGNTSVESVPLYSSQASVLHLDSGSVSLDTGNLSVTSGNVVVLAYQQSGHNLIVNGAFDTDSGWSKGGTGWTVVGGKAVATSSNGYLSQINTGSILGQLYQVSYTISGYSSGSVAVRFGKSQQIAARTTNGVFTDYITCLDIADSHMISFIADAATLSLDNVSIIPVTQSGDLVAGGTATFWHVRGMGPSPIVSACGSSPSTATASTDAKGTIAAGSEATICTITFSSAYATPPSCTVSSRSGLGLSYTTATGALVVSHPALSGTVFDYHCWQ